MARFCSTVKATVVSVNMPVTVIDSSVKLWISPHIEAFITGAPVRVMLIRGVLRILSVLFKPFQNQKHKKGKVSSAVLLCTGFDEACLRYICHTSIHPHSFNSCKSEPYCLKKELIIQHKSIVTFVLLFLHFVTFCLTNDAL